MHNQRKMKKEKETREVKTKLTEVSFKDIGIWVGEEAKISAVENGSPSSRIY